MFLRSYEAVFVSLRLTISETEGDSGSFPIGSL